jgi:hypothetical protein
MGHLSLWELCWGTWRHKRRLWRWAPLSMGTSLKKTLEEGSFDGGLYVEEGSGKGVSPYKGPIGEHGEGGSLSNRNF